MTERNSSKRSSTVPYRKQRTTTNNRYSTTAVLGLHLSKRLSKEEPIIIYFLLYSVLGTLVDCRGSFLGNNPSFLILFDASIEYF